MAIQYQSPSMATENNTWVNSDVVLQQDGDNNMDVSREQERSFKKTLYKKKTS